MYRSFLTCLVILSCTIAFPNSLLARGVGNGDQSVTAQTGKAISPEDIMTLNNMVDLALSPDGEEIAFVVLPQMSTFATPASGIWLAPTDGSSAHRLLVPAVAANRNPTWSPTGKQIAFLSDRCTTGKPHDENAESTTAQICAINRDGTNPVRLTNMPEGVAAYEWSPDGKHIAFISSDPGEDESATERGNVQLASATQPVAQLWLLDMKSGLTRLISPDTVNVADMEWSPDSKRLAIRVTDEPGLNSLFYHSRIALIDTASGQISDTAAIDAASGANWSPDGSKLTFAGIRKDGPDGPLTGGMSTDVRVLTVTDNTVMRYGEAHRGFLLHPHWTDGGRALLATSFEKTSSSLVKLEPGSQAIRTIAPFNGEISELAINHRGDVAVIGNTPDRPVDAWALGDAGFTAITALNPDVASWRLGKVGTISWQSSTDERRIHGVLITPPGYEPGTPVKTVVQLHGGPEWAWWSGWMGSWHEWGQMLASHGYAVLLPNPRGSYGQGAEFSRLAIGDWGGGDYQDVLDGVAYLVDRKIADPDRIGIGGWSYGGYLSAWAATHGGPFKAAIVGAAPTDVLAMLRTTDTPDFVLDYFGSPVENLAAYDAASPVRMLEKVHMPILVLHSAQDSRVPVALGHHFYNGLKLLGKEAEMVTYPGEGHWMSDPAYQRDIQQRVLDFFEAHVP
ncbi:S9 family peptidase [Qipengyuania sp. 483]